MKRKHIRTILLLIPAVFLIYTVSRCGGQWQKFYENYDYDELKTDAEASKLLLPTYFPYNMVPGNPDVTFGGGGFWIGHNIGPDELYDYACGVIDSATGIVWSITSRFEKNRITGNEEGIVKVNGRKVAFYYEDDPNYYLSAVFNHWWICYKVSISRKLPMSDEEAKAFKAQDKEEIIKVIESMLP